MSKPAELCVLLDLPDRITVPGQSTTLFFFPEISNGISKTKSTALPQGNDSCVDKKTPDSLMFAIVPC
jgi:hypothetical protein